MADNIQKDVGGLFSKWRTYLMYVNEKKIVLRSGLSSIQV